MYINEKECEAAGLDKQKIESIARKISRAAKEAEALGVCVFGGSFLGELRYEDDPGKGKLKIASLDGWFDGGDGADKEYGDGLRRGE